MDKKIISVNREADKSKGERFTVLGVTGIYIFFFVLKFSVFLRGVSNAVSDFLLYLWS